MSPLDSSRIVETGNIASASTDFLAACTRRREAFSSDAVVSLTKHGQARRQSSCDGVLSAESYKRGATAQPAEQAKTPNGDRGEVETTTQQNRVNATKPTEKTLKGSRCYTGRSTILGRHRQINRFVRFVLPHRSVLLLASRLSLSPATSPAETLDLGRPPVPAPATTGTHFEELG